MATDIENLILSKKYAKKIEKIYKEILCKNSDLYNDVHFVYYWDCDRMNNLIKHDPNHKACCYSDKKEIRLSDTVCDMEIKQLYEIILHELLHLKYPDYSENEIIDETKKRMPKDVRYLINEVLKNTRK